MKHIMLDLETMGTRPNAAIVALGACEFDLSYDDPIRDTFYIQVGLDSSVQAGLKIDTSTILWWMQQSDAARKQTFGRCEGWPIGDAVHRFSKFVEARGKDAAIWGNGATFDNVIIRSAFDAVKLTPPWSFRNDKCYRTVVNLLPEDKRPAFVPYGTAHNALDDAIAQALHLQKVYKALGL